MGEFHEAVSTLLEAFARGLDVIKRKRKNSPKQKAPYKDADSNLSRSLRKSRIDVRKSYERDLRRHGTGFAIGDEEAFSSLSAILFRLNAGFVSIIERFTRGHSTRTDYAALLNLSNSSRMEAIHTFDQLSKRLSKSTLALPRSPKGSSHKRKTRSPTTEPRPIHVRAKSAPSLVITPAGLVRRPKHTRSSSSTSKSSSAPSKSPSPRPSRSPRALSSSTPPPAYTPPPIDSHKPAFPLDHKPYLRAATVNAQKRKSIMSFASDSTKLGEIPEHKWAVPRMPLTGGDMAFPVRTYYPLEPYREPEKQKSRLRRLFRL